MCKILFCGHHWDVHTVHRHSAVGPYTTVSEFLIDLLDTLSSRDQGHGAEHLVDGVKVVLSGSTAPG